MDTNLTKSFIQNGGDKEGQRSRDNLPQREGANLERTYCRSNNKGRKQSFVMTRSRMRRVFFYIIGNFVSYDIKNTP